MDSPFRKVKVEGEARRKRSMKKYSCKGKSYEKIQTHSEMRLKIFLRKPKKIPAWEILTKQTSCGSKIPLTFLMVRPLAIKKNRFDVNK